MSYALFRQMADGSAPKMSQQEFITRVRVTYHKREDLRFIGHLDMQRLWERLLRRSGLPIRYSQGYHPRARLNLASALPLGFTSKAEMLDFWMNDYWAIEEIYDRLTVSAPPGLTIKSLEYVELSEDALQTRIKASIYQVKFYDSQTKEQISTKMHFLLDADQIIRTRRKKTYDLRPLILDIKIKDHEPEQPMLILELCAEPGATGRPDEVLSELGFQNTDYWVKRTAIILDSCE